MVRNYSSEAADECEIDVLDAVQLRDQAGQLLRRLIASREQSERRFAEVGQRDAIKFITGRSALDSAIHTTRRMMDEMDELLRTLNHDMGRLQQNRHNRSRSDTPMPTTPVAAVPVQ